jgi:hypothetical protein
LPELSAGHDAGIDHEKKTLDGRGIEAAFGFGCGWRDNYQGSCEIQTQYNKLSKSGAENGYAFHVRSDQTDEYPCEVRGGGTNVGARTMTVSLKSPAIDVAVDEAMTWSTKFNHPIKWGASTLRTLHDARDFILQLPSSKQVMPAWQAATEALREAAKYGGVWLELARIGMMKALLGPEESNLQKHQ